MQVLISILIFLTVSIYVFVVNSFALAPIALLKVLVLPMVLLLLVLYRSSITSWRKFLANRGKWFLLFWGTVFLQLLVLSTGGLQSPFLILIHLFMVGLSFVFSFSISLLFLFFSFVLIFGQIALTQDVGKYIAEHPQTIILQIASLIPIVAVGYIISQQYRLKDMLSNMLGTKVKTDEAILERLNELIIVTDPQLIILSVNDAVERALQKSRSELLNMPLFPTLLLRIKDGKLVDKAYFFSDSKTNQMVNTFIEDCTLVNSHTEQKKFMLQVQPIENTDGNITQISFIMSFIYQDTKDQHAPDVSTERARAKYEAMAENLKNTLLKENNATKLQQVLLMDTIENDVFTMQSFKNQETKDIHSRIDIAQLCKQTVLIEQEFAKIFQVPVTFEIQNFGWKNIAPLTVQNYLVTPDQLTGPFFTVECNAQHVGLLVKKLLDLVVLLASTKADAQAHLSVEPSDKDEVIIKIFGTCPTMTEEDLQNIFIPYYNSLSTKTNLQVGSGLEGYLIKKISTSLGIDIDMKYNDVPSTNIVFTLKLPKNFSTQNTPVSVLS